MIVWDYIPAHLMLLPLKMSRSTLNGLKARPLELVNVAVTLLLAKM